MPKKKSTAFYRVLLREAWGITWQHKMLWIFGFLAAIISTGGVMDVAIRGLRGIRTGPSLLETIANGSFIGYGIFVQFVQQMEIIGPWRGSFTIGFFLFLFLLLVLAAVWAQGALVHGILSKKSTHLRTLLEKSRPAFWHILAIDLLSLTATGLLVILTTLILVTAANSGAVLHFLLSLLGMLIFCPLVIGINIIATLAVVDTVEKKSHALDAIEHAAKLFRRHALVTFELGIIVFLLVFLAGLTYLLALILLAVPLTVLSALSLLSTVPPLFVFTTGLSVLVYVLCLLAFTGAAVCFQYATWVLFYQKTQNKIDLKRIRAKLHRMWWG